MFERPQIKVIAKEPPGGRCRLYMSYADALVAALDAESEIVFPQEEDTLQAPGLMANGVLIEPEDRFILSPDDICRGLSAVGIDRVDDTIRQGLEKVEEDFMEEFK